MLEESTQLRDHLEKITAYYRQALTAAGFDLIEGSHPIVPVMLYDEELAVEYANRMVEKGVYVVAFSYPVVPKGKRESVLRYVPVIRKTILILS